MRYSARYRDRGVVGVGLGGLEAEYPPEPYAAGLRRSRGSSGSPRCRTRARSSGRRRCAARSTRSAPTGSGTGSGRRRTRACCGRSPTAGSCSTSARSRTCARGPSTRSTSTRCRSSSPPERSARSRPTTRRCSAPTSRSTARRPSRSGSTREDFYAAGLEGALCDEETKARLREIGDRFRLVERPPGSYADGSSSRPVSSDGHAARPACLTTAPQAAPAWPRSAQAAKQRRHAQEEAGAAQLGGPALLLAAAPPREMGLRVPGRRVRGRLRLPRRRLRLDRDQRHPARQLLRRQQQLDELADQGRAEGGRRASEQHGGVPQPLVALPAEPADRQGDRDARSRATGATRRTSTSSTGWPGSTGRKAEDALNTAAAAQTALAANNATPPGLDPSSQLGQALASDPVSKELSQKASETFVTMTTAFSKAQDAYKRAATAARGTPQEASAQLQLGSVAVESLRLSGQPTDAQTADRGLQALPEARADRHERRAGQADARSAEALPGSQPGLDSPRCRRD